MRPLFVKPEHDFAPRPPERESEFVAVRPPRTANHLWHFHRFAQSLFQSALQIETLDLLLYGVRKMLQIAPAASAEMTANGFYTIV